MGNAMMAANDGFWIEKLTQMEITSTNRKSKETDPTIALTNLPAGTHSEYKTSFISTIL